MGGRCAGGPGRRGISLTELLVGRQGHPTEEALERDEVVSRKAVLGVLLGGPSMDSSYSGTRRPRSGARASFNKQSKRRSLSREGRSGGDRIPWVSARIAV